VTLPLFAVVEGVDRVGKDIQSRLLSRKIGEVGPVRRFTTPDRSASFGVLTGKLLRRGIWVTGETEEDTERLVLEALHVAGRYETGVEVARCLALGVSVVCSRWWPSTVAYGKVDGLGEEWLRKVSSLLPEPDLLIYLRVDHRRVADRLDPRERNEDVGKQVLVAGEYDRLWSLGKGEAPEKWAVVDGGGSVEEVGEQIWEVVLKLRPEWR
jgi:thymidylate kinase